MATMLQPGMVAALGIPYDGNSSFLRGTASAPSFIRKALHSDSTNLCAENGVDLGAETGWTDLGDLEFDSERPSFEQIEEHIDRLLESDLRVLTLGGDHSISYPIVRAHARKHANLNILHLDAHPDLYDELDGSRISHACPFARIMEEKLAVRLVQVGIRTMNPHQRQQAERFGVEVFEARYFHALTELTLDAPLYLSVDLDVLDPAFAPGVSHHEPGGLTTRDVLDVIQGLGDRLVGADIVELNPERDPLGITAMVAAKLTKEIVVRMLEIGR